MPTLVENQRFERYRIIRLRGSGVSGESYEAEDTILLRKVMLKLIHPWALLAEGSRRQFFREMQGISLLNHPYLATILDYGEIDGRLYVVRRYVTGGSLLSNDGRLWFQPPFSVSDAIHYGHQLAQVLEYIHRHGYLHGALTLSNILVLRGANLDNEPDFAPFLLADTGLANFVRRFGQPQIQFLPITAAPEQLGKRVTPASDQFALAVILYFWLTGRLPYLGSPEEIEQQKLSETITHLTSLNSNTTFEQETILRRALAVYPEERYSSILAFADALVATLIAPPHLSPSPDLSSREETIFEFERIPETDPVFPLELESLPVEQQLKDERLPEPSPTIETDFEQQPWLESFPISEPLLASETDPGQQVQLVPETLPRTDPWLVIEPELKQPSLPTSEPLPAPQPSLTIEPAPEPIPQPDPEPLPVPAPEPIPQPAPEPIPQPSPESLPQPAPIPSPQPAPEPSIQPEPIPLPQPDPDPLPQPAPDIFQPVPQPTIEPPPDPLTDTSAGPESPEAQKATETRNAPDISAWLIIAPPDGGRPSVFMLEREETFLGRAGSDDVLLDRDPSISRHHALLKLEEGRYVVYDQRSASGVSVNDQKLAADMGHILANGDSISIGSYELVFRCSMPSLSDENDEAHSVVTGNHSMEGHYPFE